MKKLMIAAAIVCAAAFAQAATVDWTSGKLFTAANKDGGFSTTAIGAAAAAEVFLLSGESEYNTFLEAYNKSGDMSAVWKAYQDGKGSFATASDSGATAGRSSSSTLSTPSTVGDHYAAIIYTYTDEALGQDFYIANIAKATVANADLGGSAQNLGTHFLGDAAGTATGGWVAVPEPTTGLLMLLGMAGLALRRRRA